MRTFFVCAAFAAVLLPADARAQTVILTESELLAQLGNASPRVQAARAGVDVARADILAAGRWPNPRVTFNRESVAGVAENMVTVSQVLRITGRRRLDVSAAVAQVEATSARAEDQIRRVRADLRLAFTDLWSTQERERELERSRVRLSELAGILGRREAAGDAAGFDRLRAEREVLEVEASRAVATTERAQAQAILASFLGVLREAAVIEAVRPAAQSAMLPAVEDLVARAETSRGDLIALARDVEAAALSARAAGRRAIPEPELVAGTKTSNVAGGHVGSIIGVHVALPLFDRAQPERAAAVARGRQARAEADVLRQTIRAQIVAWRVAIIERRAIAERHRAALGTGTTEIERIAQVSYEAGERGILELLDAYRTGSSTRIRQAELDAAVRQAEIELEYVSGWEIP
jgi:cobalt-zinc-cadmium efflux system outer membrane protein